MPTTTNPTKTIVNLLEHIVSMPTLSADTATNAAALDWVEEQIKHLPLYITRHEHNSFSSLVATTRRTKHPRLWLLAHMDVVPGAIQTFLPKTKNGRLYGRGVYDMKHAIAIYITLLQQLGDTLPQYDLGLMITTDEELGGPNGAGWLFKELGYRGGAVFVPDSGSPWKLEMGAKGVSWWELTATGRTGHGSRPWESRNAIEAMIRFVDLLRPQFVTEPCGDPDHAHSTMSLNSITSLAGGNAFNRVPDTVTARLDIRYHPDTSAETIASWIKAAQVQEPSVKATQALLCPTYRVPDDAPEIQLFRRIVREVAGRELTAGISHGSSDSYHIVPLGIPTINASPLGGGFHIAEEWVDIEDLGRYYEVTRRFVDAYALKSNHEALIPATRLVR